MIKTSLSAIASSLAKLWGLLDDERLGLIASGMLITAVIIAFFDGRWIYASLCTAFLVWAVRSDWKALTKREQDQ